MSDINYFEIIQNKLDALVEKIVQKENSDEDFRITYAQILEKINTKMDVFSNTDNEQYINALAKELITLIKDRQVVVDAKFNAVKAEFDNINDILENSLKTTELVAAFNKVQNQINNFSEEQENQKFAFNSIVSHIEKFGTLEDTNAALESHFSVVKEQNTTINDTLTKYCDSISQLNQTVEQNNQASIDTIANILVAIKEFSAVLGSGFEDVNKTITDLIDNKIQEITNTIKMTDSAISVLNGNVATLLKAVDSIYEYEPFQNVKKEICEVASKISVISDVVKQIVTKKDLLDASNANKEEIKNYTKSLISDLEQTLLTNLDFSALDEIKGYTEKMFFQGTEVLKDEVWAVKDAFAEFNATALKSGDFNSKIDELKQVAVNVQSDITDVISEESVAASNQLNEISASISDLKTAISEIILNDQNEQITEALNGLQAKFVTQLVQIADNISFSEDADELHDNLVNCTEELKDKITSDIADIKNDISILRGANDLNNECSMEILDKIETFVKDDVSNDLKTIISGLKLLTSGLMENQDHIYTMPDIESDLSKIRFELDKIQLSINSDTEDFSMVSKLKDIEAGITKLEASNNNQDIAEIKEVFNSINEDITSISKRTNKLILTSDEVSKTLKSNISAFSVVLGSFERQSRDFYNSAFMVDLNEKIDYLAKMTTALVNSDQAMNEAFMYIGEWIDSTSDSFVELKDDVYKIKSAIDTDDSQQFENIENTLVSVAQQVSAQESVIAELVNKIEIQDSKLTAIDEKLNVLATQIQENSDIKSLVEFVASQITQVTEKLEENEKMLQKIESMEKQLKKIEHNVSAITDYLDDEIEE